MNENLISTDKRSITIPPARRTVFDVNVIAFRVHSTIIVEKIPQLCGAWDLYPCENHGFGNGLIFER